jgi:hypothetical protein
MDVFGEKLDKTDYSSLYRPVTDQGPPWILLDCSTSLSQLAYVLSSYLITEIILSQYTQGSSFLHVITTSFDTAGFLPSCLLWSTFNGHVLHCCSECSPVNYALHFLLILLPQR